MWSASESGKHFPRERATAPGAPKHYPGIARSARLAALLGAILWPMAASAGVITINFPADVVPSTMTSGANATADGFRISPSSEYTLVPAGGAPPGIISQGIGWDSDGPANPNYLGGSKPSLASLFIDDGGTPFSLLGVTFIATLLDDNFTMTSSKGGVFDVPAHLGGTLSVSFGGDPPLWTDISWLTFSYFDAGAPTAGLEQLVVAVDEPQSLAMIAISLLLLLGLRRIPQRARRAR